MGGGRIGPDPTHLRVVVVSWGSRAVTVLVQLLSVRLLLSSLGADRYAVFVLLGSLNGWFLLGDLGLGTALQNHVSGRRATGEGHGRDVAEAALLAALLLLAFASLLALAAPLLSPLLFRKFPFLGAGEGTALLFAAGASFLGSAAGGVVYKVWYAEQKGDLANLVPAAAALLGYGAVWALHRGGAGSLLASVAAYFGPAALLPLLFLVRRIRREGPSSPPLSPRTAASLLGRRALSFWTFNLMAAAVLQVDYLVMSQTVAPREIVAYNLTARVFEVVFFVYYAVVLALWPSFAEALARGERRGVVTAARRNLLWGALWVAAATAAIALLMPRLARFLSPREAIEVPLPFLLLYGAYMLLRVLAEMPSVILQSMSRLRPFFVLVPVQAAVNLALQSFLSPRFGIYGILGGLVLSTLLTVSWGLPFAAARALGDLPEGTPVGH